MSDPEDEREPASDTTSDSEGISDEQLPADLRPGEDNPLAEPLEEGEEVGGISAPDADATA